MKAVSKIYDHIDPKKLEKIREFSKNKPTPHLIIDMEHVRERYDELESAMPSAKIYYAVKASPVDEVILELDKRGSYFDVSSRYEIDQLLSLGIEPAKMSFGNTIKKEEDIAYAYEKGICIFTTDSESDIEKLARQAPEASVIFRLLLESGGAADWPLSRKFGAHPNLLFNLIKKAHNLGLDTYGLSFHVGSQQRDIGEWDSALALCKHLFESLKEEGIKLRCINLGGGFPARYISPTASTEKYADLIKQYLKEDFGDEDLEIILEPGRSLVGGSGVIVSEVILVANKSETEDTRWVYLDVGKFNGLIETLDEAMKYPIFVEGKEDDTDTSEVILAGPTCDSYDTLYEDYKYQLPRSLKDGDRVNVFTTGAYTLSYCSVNFNGFPPMKMYILPED